MSSKDPMEAAAAVAMVLAAPDHYSVLGAPRQSTTVEMRQCYVRASLRVHPDKNGHPDATRAFQRVASAWRELGDEHSRWRYDQELSVGRGRLIPGGSDSYEGVHVPPPTSAEEAFEAFARATAACASSGDLDYAEAQAIFYAQQMAQARAQMYGGLSNMQMGGIPAGGFGNMHMGGMQPGFGQNPNALSMAAGGMAYSAVLWLAGASTSALGFEMIGSFMRRIAVVQGLSQVVMGSIVAYQDPNIRPAIEARAAPVTKALGNVGTAMWGGIETVRQCDHLARLEDAWGSMPSCLPRVRSGEEITNRARDTTSAPFSPGTWVEISGLMAASDLNGRMCKVVRFEGGKGRYAVRLLPAAPGSMRCRRQDADSENTLKLVRPENLVVAEPERSKGAPETSMQFI